jgi:hypothetical protein
MKVSEKQLLVMIRVLEGSLSIADRRDMPMFGISREERTKVWEQIMNQQSDELKEVKD